jgi:hypothetical protein
MRPLTLDDLLSLDEYAARRREYFASMQRYLDGYRRVRVGPRLTIIFENRQTLWFRLQELLHVARMTEARAVQAELDLYNRLLPTRGLLQAALLMDQVEESHPSADLAFWDRIAEGALCLVVGDWQSPARLLTCRPEDRALGTAHWLEIPIDSRGQSLLADFRQTAWVQIAHESYHHESPPLSEEVRQSLLDDLELSDRDG